MSRGLAPKLPLMKDPSDGYALIKDYSSLVKQNLKMLLLTAPGERIMYPEFGVGLRNFLFENNINATYDQIETRIRQQVKTYMPFVEVRSIFFKPVFSESGTNENGVHINMDFRVIPFDLFDSMEINIATN